MEREITLPDNFHERLLELEREMTGEAETINTDHLVELM